MEPYTESQKTSRNLRKSLKNRFKNWLLTCKGRYFAICNITYFAKKTFPNLRSRFGSLDEKHKGSEGSEKFSKGFDKSFKNLARKLQK